MKNVLKAFIFTIILLVLLGIILHISSYKDMGGGAGWQRFYASEKNTMDVISFGNSHSHCTVDQSILWDQYGIASYSMTAGNQNVDGTYYFIKEALKYQTPKVILVECFGMLGDELDYSEATIYRNTLGLRYSLNQLEAVQHFASGGELDFENKMQLLAKLPIVHSRYKELTPEDFAQDRPYFKGYVGTDEVYNLEQNQSVLIDESAELYPDRMNYVDKIIELCQEKRVGVIFFVAPTVEIDNDKQKRVNYLATYFAEQGIPFFDFNKLSAEIGLDYSHDLRDTGHLNDFGAAKVTKYLGDYIESNYIIDDHSMDKRYDEWNLYSRYMNGRRYGYKLHREEMLHDYLEDVIAVQDRYRITVSFRGNYRALGDFFFDDMNKLGLTQTQLELGGTYVIENGMVTSVDEIDSMGIVENGIIIEVYDTLCDVVVDCSGCDVYLGEMMKRD